MGSIRQARRWALLVAGLVAVASPAAGAEPTAGPPASSAAAPAASSAAAPAEVRFAFDDGRFAGTRPLSIAGGAVRAETRDGGQAVRFPPLCPTYGGRNCPRVVLESSFTTNPGAGPLRYGAAVRLAATETAIGENVMQKGFSHGHSQFKLQVDGDGGRPSCVLVGASSPRIHLVTAGTSVADGQWHTIECARAGTALTVMVDGTIAGQANVPASLSIVNSDPLRIGGKGLSPNNDQFHGALDDVFVVIGE
jgi:hypothetical protein